MKQAIELIRYDPSEANIALESDILALFEEVFPEQSATFSIDNDYHPCSVALDTPGSIILGGIDRQSGKDKLAAFAFLSYADNDPEEGYIDYLGVNPEYQRQGIGKIVLSAIESYFKSTNASRISLLPLEGTEQFYIKSGFNWALDHTWEPSKMEKIIF